jgi:trimeric autotransporter adhesin
VGRRAELILIPTSPTAMKPNALKRLIGAALLGVFASFGAQADDPVAGATLFSNSCSGSSCHGSTPLTSNTTKIYNGRNARNVIDSAIGSIGEMNSLRSAFPAGSTALADLAAYLGNAPSTVSFPSTSVGSTSAAQTVTVYASLKSGNSLSALTVSTTGDFTRSGGSCATTVGTGLNCTILVTFSPSASGARTGTLSVTHNKTLTPITIALSGTGSGVVTPAPVASISPTSLTLASTAIGATSAAQNVTVSNTGNAALALSALTLSNATDFIIAGGTCAAGGSVAAGANCTVSVAFKPAAGATGARSGSLSITHNAAGTPGTVSLSGSATAAAAPAASLTSSLAFGSVNVGTASTAQTATLSNTGTAALTLGTLTTGSTEFTVTGGTCAAGGSLAAAASCTVIVGFTPSAAGARSANLVVTHNAAAAQSSTALSGAGVALSPVIGVSPTTLSFTQTIATTSAAQTITVSNSGNAPLAISALALSGAQAAEYQIATGTTCTAGGSVAANASCVVKVAFAPTASGARSASLSIMHGAAGSPSSITLNGTGTATAQPAISLNAATLSFASQTLGSTSAAQAVTVSNSGSAALNFTGLTLTGTAATDFTRSGTCTTTGTLAAGASCTVSFTFAPGAVGARSATLTVASNASNGSAVLSLAGTGAAVPTPSVGLAPGSLAFGNQTTAVASTARSVTLSNSGSGALALSAITATSGFGVSHNCGSSVAAGASCTLSITFTPAASGAATGSVSVASNATGSPHTVSLAGSGVAASPVLTWSPTTTALAFGDVSVGGSPAAQSLTLLNQGPGSVTLQQLTLAGTNAADFSLGAGSCAVNSALAQGASCTVGLAFQPDAIGARGAMLQVVSSGTNPPDVALSGNGTALAQPAIGVVPGTLNFVVSATGTAVSSQTLTLQNTGSAVLQVTSVAIASGSFTLSAAATNGCATAPFDLMPGQSCVLTVGWSSSAAGTETGMVEITSTAAAAPRQVALQAAREAPAATASISNAGQGGCSIARGHTLTDPTLWLLALIAAGVLWRRRAQPAMASVRKN